MMKKLFKILAIASFLLIGLFYFFLYQADLSPDVLKNKYAYGPSQFIEIEGMDVHYRMEGSGPPVLLLHGTAASLHTWEPWAILLRDSFTVLTVDLPAFGLTGPNENNDYTTTAYNRFINQFTSALDIDTFSIGGNSLGGYISWNYALDFPDRIDKLILIDAAGFPTEPVALFKLIKNPILGPLLSKVSVRSLVEKNLKEVYADQTKITDGLIQRYYDLSLRKGNRQALRARVNRKEKSRVEQISKINNKTLIMWGAKDQWIPVEHAHLFHDQMPNSELIIYPDAGHVPMEELAEQTGQDVYKFLLK